MSDTVKQAIITGPSTPVVTDKPKSRQQQRWRNINKWRGRYNAKS
jgi:hypothetical protein